MHKNVANRLKFMHISVARAEAKLVWIMPNRNRGRRSQLCAKCHVLKGRNEEMLYADYIDGKLSYMEITLEIRN